jgi:hypothetical protein
MIEDIDLVSIRIRNIYVNLVVTVSKNVNMLLEIKEVTYIPDQKS